MLLAGAWPLDAQRPRLAPPSDVPRYVAPHASAPVTIDGHIGEEAWQRAPWTAAFVDIRGLHHAAPQWETRAKLLWDEEHLYVAASLEEPHLWATLTERDAIIYRDHDFEVFLDPESDGVAYYEFEVNALGTMFDLFLDKPYRDGGSADIAWDADGLDWAVALDGSLNDPADQDRGWTVEIAIPWRSLVPPGSSVIRPPPRDGEAWRVNFSRVQWPLRVVDGRYEKVREPVDWTDHPEDNWVWSPQGAINMHMPERWGVVEFRTIPESSEEQ